MSEPEILEPMSYMGVAGVGYLAGVALAELPAPWGGDDGLPLFVMVFAVAALLDIRRGGRR